MGKINTVLKYLVDFISIRTPQQTGALEGQYFRHKEHLVELSEQNLIDCSTDYGNDGCYGGNAVNAYEYIKHNNGIEAEANYPYEGVQGNCR